MAAQCHPEAREKGPIMGGGLKSIPFPVSLGYAPPFPFACVDFTSLVGAAGEDVPTLASFFVLPPKFGKAPR